MRCSPKGRRDWSELTKSNQKDLKADLIQVLRIAMNQVERLKLGWFVVRNRTTQEIKEGVTILQRHEIEKECFRNAPWSEVPRSRVGIPALKPFLGQLLYDHVRREFPGVVKEIEDLYDQAQREAHTLGSPRETTMEQRQYLTHLTVTYQQSTYNALRGNYGPVSSQHPLKLRMHMKALGDQFEAKITKEGHTYAFEGIDGSLDKEYVNGSNRGIRKWIRKRYQDSRGAELPGTVNPSVMERLFREQSKSWELIATEFLSQAVQAVAKYHESACSSIVGDPQVRKSLETHLKRWNVEASGGASKQLKDLLSDERGGILQTINHYFADTLSKIREGRFMARLKKAGLETGNFDIDLENLVHHVHLSNEDQAVNDIHDVLKTYYKVAIKRFMDNVVMSVVERELLGPQASVHRLTPDFVLSLSDEELGAICAEDYTTSASRIGLCDRIERLRKALEIVRRI